MRQPRSPWAPVVFACVAPLLGGRALAQQEAPPSVTLSYEFDSGWAENTSSEPQVVISFPVVIEGAPWMRLYFDDIALAGDLLAGNGAILRMTALLDGGIQEMDARHVRQWQNTSCYFNGDTVLVEVLAQPNSGWSRLAMRQVIYGQPFTPEETICGPQDNRVLSSDPRAARILPVGCTGWLIDDCAQCFLTAGHCGGGLGVAQFNVPLSNSNGSLNNPSPNDQYAIDPASLQGNGGQGVGNDWAYFGAFPNSNTGLRPAEAAGSTYNLANPPAVSGNNIRVTGYGVDSSPNTSNQVQQTEVGPMATSSGTLIQYVTDTTGGNSGSPVIWENTGQAIGIHTHGGCSSTGGANSGTGANHPALQAAIANPRGICAAGMTFPQPLPELIPPGQSTPFVVELAGTGTAVTLHYRLQGGAYLQVAMTPLTSTTYSGAIPSPACGDNPEFYFSYQDNVCGLITSPLDAPTGFYTAVVGTPSVDFNDSFEADLGWTTSSFASAGDWERGVPVNDPGTIYDPISDSDGSGNCYLTGNALGDSDVDGGEVRLFSPIFDLSAPGAFVSYDYFLGLSNESGVDRMEVAARNNGVGPWSVLVQHQTDGGLFWRNQVFSATEFVAAGVAASSSVQMRFKVYDEAAASTVEAGLDAFRLGSAGCGSLGTNFCVSGVNGAAISASGSASVSANDLVLVGNGLPSNVNGLFFYANGQANQPLGGGTLCLSGTTGIFRLQPVQNSGPAGQMTHAVDLSNPPSAAGQVTVGSTWNYQLWFRDGGTSDLTDALQVVFTP